MNMDKLQSLLFKVLLLILAGVLAWQSQLHYVSFDLTKNQRNSLSEDTIRLLKTISAPVKFTLLISPGSESLSTYTTLIKRYQYHQPLIEMKVVNPDLAPELLREYDIRQDGVILIQYGDKTEKLQAVSELHITNALQRLIRAKERWIVFLEGHGERHPYGDANFDISSFAKRLASQGFIIESLDLTKTPQIPDNTQVLVIASPKTDFLAGEFEQIKQYIQQGGNVLWLTEPEHPHDSLADLLHISILPGVIVDPNSQLLGLNRVDYALINDYIPTDITRYISVASIFPQAVAFEINDNTQNWSIKPLLQTQEHAWNETGKLEGEIIAGDQSDESLGPLNLALMFERELTLDKQSKLQRAVVIGDGDFLANQYLGNGANAELGLNIINWLSHDDALIAIQSKAAPDTQLILSDIQKLALAIGFLIVVPLILMVTGITIWLRRKKH